MTPLRQKLIDEIQLRGFSPHTQDSYVRCVAGLAKFYHRPPDQIGDEELKAYLLHLLRKRKLACSSLIVAVSGLRFFYGHPPGHPAALRIPVAHPGPTGESARFCGHHGFRENLPGPVG